MSTNRKRRVNTTPAQLQMYLEFMENDYIFRSGTINPTVEVNYIPKKWEELKNLLNAGGDGPSLSAEQWKKRFNDWKYQTKSKYRKIQQSQRQTGGGPQIDMQLTTAEERGLSAWGRVTVTGTPMVNLYDGLEPNDEGPSGENLDREQIFEVIQIQEPQPSTSRASEIIEEQMETIEILPELHERTFKINEVKEPRGTSRKKQNRTPKPLNEAVHSLLQNNTDNCNVMVGALNNIVNAYIDIEEKKLAFKQRQMQFEIAKYKYENKDFQFE